MGHEGVERTMGGSESQAMGVRGKGVHWAASGRQLGRGRAGTALAIGYTSGMKFEHDRALVVS